MQAHKAGMSVPVPNRDVIPEVLASALYHAESLYVERMALPLLTRSLEDAAAMECLDFMFRHLLCALIASRRSVREVTIVL